MRHKLFGFALALALNMGCGVDNTAATGAPRPPQTQTPTQRTNNMKIRLTIGETVITGTLVDSKATQDFISLLPLTLKMNDLFRREKFAHLPRAISEEGQRTHTYQAGDIAYWPPGPDVAIFYRHDGQKIPAPGIIVLGRIENGLDALNVPGSITAKVELDRTNPIGGQHEH
jgi:hypothetical protein